MLTDGRQKQVSLTKPDGDQQTVKLAGEDTVKAEEDIDPGVIDQINNRIMPHFNILMLTSGRAEKMIVKLAESIDAQTVRVLTVDNHFFGRDINCGGLLTVRDFLRARKEIKTPEEFDAAFTTGRFLGPDGKDLTGQHWITIERKFGLPFYFL